MQNGSKNVPKMHWLSFQAHPTAIKIEKRGPKRRQEEQQIDQGDPKWSKRAPKAIPSDPKNRQNPTFCSTRLPWGPLGLAWFCFGAVLLSFFTVLGSNLLDLFMFFQVISVTFLATADKFGWGEGWGWGGEKAHFPNAPPFASNSCKTKSNDWHGAALLCNLYIYGYPPLASPLLFAYQ